MALDVLLFSGLLYLTGGPNNPFSFLYLIPIALASITMRAAWTWMLVGLSLACSAFLFATHQPLALGDHSRHMSLHLRGMWVAFGVAASFIVYFLLRVRRALERHERELDAARAGGARQERLASLATLAAGAAHELLTPLSTIAVIAGDLQRDVAQRGRAPRARRGRAAGPQGGRSLPRHHRAHARRRRRHRGRRLRPRLRSTALVDERGGRASPRRASPCAPRSLPRSSIGR